MDCPTSKPSLNVFKVKDSSGYACCVTSTFALSSASASVVISRSTIASSWIPYCEIDAASVKVILIVPVPPPDTGPIPPTTVQRFTGRIKSRTYSVNASIPNVLVPFGAELSPNDAAYVTGVKYTKNPLLTCQDSPVNSQISSTICRTDFDSATYRAIDGMVSAMNVGVAEIRG